MGVKYQKGGSRMADRFNLTNGPNELDLFVLGLARRQTVFFHLEDLGIILGIVINGLEVESPNAKQWLFKGFITEVKGSFYKGGDAVGCEVNGYYSYIHNRTGWIDLDSYRVFL